MGSLQYTTSAPNDSEHSLSSKSFAVFVFSLTTAFFFPEVLSEDFSISAISPTKKQLLN
jgi:hypothetical protein